MKESIKKIIAFMLSFALCMQTINIPVYVSAAEEVPNESNVQSTETNLQGAELQNGEEKETIETEQLDDMENPETQENQNVGDTAAENSGEIAGNSGESAENSEEIAEDSVESAENSSEIVENSGESAENSGEIADNGDEVADDSDAEVSSAAIEENNEGQINIRSTADFISLSNRDPSEYQNATIVITRGDDVSFNLTQPGADGQVFDGLGSLEYPFMGTVIVTNGTTSDIEIPVGRSFFNYLDQSATIEEGLYLQVGKDTTDPLLAAYVTNVDHRQEPLHINLKIGAQFHTDDGTEIKNSFGGLIGEIGTGSAVEISVKNDGATVLKHAGNLGMFSNTLASDASLTISGYTDAEGSNGNLNYELTTSGGHAGGLIGYMSSGSTLTVASEVTLSGTVTSTKTGSSAGGLVGYAESGAKVRLDKKVVVSSTVDSKANAGALFGYAENLVFTFGDSIYFNVSGASLVSRQTDDKAGAGGIAGYYKWDNSVENACSTFDAAQFQINNLIFNDIKVGGGFFGILENTCSSNTLLSFTDKDITDTVTDAEYSVTSELCNETIKYANVAGLFGEYWQTNASSGISVTNMNIQTTISCNDVSCFAGLIAWIAEKPNNIARNSFVDVDNVNIEMNRKTKPTNFGGLIADNQSPIFLNVGTLTVNAPNYEAGRRGAGIITRLSGNSVVRFHGTLDLSDCCPKANSTNYAQLILAREAGIVYAVGNGTTKINDSYDWVFNRASTTLAISDIGDYGEVVRLDGEKLAEVQSGTLADSNLSPSNASSNTVLNYATQTHQIALFIIGAATDTGENIQINSLRDFVALSMHLQWNNTSFNGFINGYSWGKGKGSELLDDKFILNTDIDLSGTGVTSLTRDNDSNSFNGTFDGGSHTITMATGEIYGLRNDELVENNSRYRSCGQIYSHNRIGLFGQTQNATINNVTIDGNYYFSVLKDNSYIGAVTAYANGNVKLKNVTVNADLNNNEYKGDNGGIELPNNKKGYYGGLVGVTANSTTLSLDNCTWSSSIVRSYDFNTDSCIGGLVGRAGSQNKITITNSTVSGSIRSFVYDKLQCVGGVVAKILADYSKPATTMTIEGLTINGLTISGDESKDNTEEQGIYNGNNSCGGFLGYSWLNTNATFKGVTINNSSLINKNLANTAVGVCVYNASGYWKVGDGTNAGITFGTGNTISIGSKKGGGSSALLLAIARDTDNGKTGNTAYIEIMNNGYVIDSSTAVTIPSDKYFDDLVGYTEFGDGLSAVVSIGLTDVTAENAVLIDEAANNSWKNKCKINNGTFYRNPDTRYYYNVDYYREENSEGHASNLDLSTSIGSAGDLLCWSLYQYAAENIRKYFAMSVGGKINGAIDLTGVSYYPVKGNANIDGATITFAYEEMNGKETTDNRQFDKDFSQHYQMQTGLFSEVKAADGTKVIFNVNDLTLIGSFGCYQRGKKSGVLVCDSIAGYNVSYQAEVMLTGVKLNGIQCKNGTNLPLLINSIGAYTSTTVDNIYTMVENGTPTCYTNNGVTSVVASALIGAVGGSTANNVNISFSDMGLDARTDPGGSLVYGTYRSIFETATFIADYQYADTASGGSYNFETTSPYITYGKEISNTSSGRNKFNDGETSQYCYYDTYGTTEYVYDGNGPGSSSREIAERFATGYLPYVGIEETYTNTNHELDINQKAYFIVDGCGTYGHPYQIKNVQDENGNLIVSAANQLIAVMNVLDGKGSGTVLMVNKSVLQAQTEKSDVHVGSSASDALYIKSGIAWYPAVRNGNKYKKASNENQITNAAMMAYLRNAYFEIEQDITMDLSKFSGIGGEAVNSAFSGVIVGKKMDNNLYPTITLTGVKPVSNRVVGGLIRYSQGSVVKNLNVTFDNVSVLTAGDSKTPTCFGGVIGWVIGGDNIIDGVTVSSDVVNVTGENANLMAVGGYVGYVGGNDCLKGGGVVFRNIQSSGLTKVSGNVTNTEVSDGNSKYYWNPYIGRVLDGYACAESGTCESMGTNTNKNYLIPKISTDAESITVNDASVQINTAQDLWILSSIVNSGSGCKVSTDSVVNNAYYYGRARTGTYDGVGTVTIGINDGRDEEYSWGGVGSGNASTTYLLQFTSNIGVMSSLTSDAKDWVLTLNGTTVYDMTVYGNGFRGIGLSYYYDGITDTNPTSAYGPQRARVFHLAILNGNNNTICYSRHIYEYASEPSESFNGSSNDYTVKQAGLFTAYNQGNSAGSVQNLTIQMEITSNISRNGTTDEKTRTAFGGCFGRSVSNYSTNTTFQKVQVTGLSDMKPSTVQNAYYAGGIFGKVTFGNELIFQNCSITNLNISNVAYGGGIGGNSAKRITLSGCEVSNAGIQINTTGYAGGLIGRIEDNLTVSETSINNLNIDGTSVEIEVGGIVGFAKKVSNISDTTVKNIKIAAKGNCGGIIGRNNDNSSQIFKNVEILDSKIATLSEDRGTGALMGYINNGSLTAFNVLSRNNVIGYLVNGTSLDSNASTLQENGKVDFSKLSFSNIGKRTNTGYVTYSNITSTTEFNPNDQSGIWVGNANWKPVKIMAASRQGDYSAIKNFGVKGTASGNYVVYADYTGTSQADANDNAASKINNRPETGIQFEGTSLTGDGAYLNENTVLSQKVIADTKENNWMKGHFGADVSRTLDRVVNSFDSMYGSIVTTYKTEEPNAVYSTEETEDLPIIVLEMMPSTELNMMLKQYISILTNVDQTSTALYSSINATTYAYSNGSWSVAENQTMGKNSSGLLKINAGEYDNTRNQITIIDVTFKSPITQSNDYYHLYIPVIVKKVMDVTFAVKTVNGATGYVSGYNTGGATLASFGENYTSLLTYSYKWTAAEWNNAIASGESFLWNFTKQVNVGTLQESDKENLRLTLVDNNRHGESKTYYQTTGKTLSQNGTLLFDSLEDFSSVPICDLLDLEVSDGTPENPGKLKIVDSTDTTATLRIWDDTTKAFKYYAPKDETNDPAETGYYNVSLKGSYNDSDVVTASESYYLVMNCIAGSQMYNNVVSLGTSTVQGGNIPARLTSSGNAVYVLGDFYTIHNLEINSTAKIPGSPIMKVGTNDVIDITLTSDIVAGAAEFNQYVADRFVYFQYAVKLVDQDGMPVNIEASKVTVTSLKIGDTDVPLADDLSANGTGYVVHQNGSMYYITVKAKGGSYIGKAVTANVRFSYEDGISLIVQFPTRNRIPNAAVWFQTDANMAYQLSGLGGSKMTAHSDDDTWYYTEENAVATVNYDSYNIMSADGNSSQLGLNGRETKDQPILISSRAMFNAMTSYGLNTTDPTNGKYPYYLEGKLSLGKKTETDKPEGIGKTYEDVDINTFLSDIVVSSAGRTGDVTSAGLGAQSDGSFKFRIQLSKEQVQKILSEQILIDINYKVKTGSLLEGLTGGQYANYKVTLSAVLKNSELTELTNEPSDYLIYTNAKVYLGIIGGVDTDLS